MSEEKIVSIEKLPWTESQEIHIQHKFYKGREILDIRRYIKTAGYTGYSTQGIAIPYEKRKEVVEAILRVTRE